MSTTYIPEWSRVQTKRGSLYTAAVGEASSQHSLLEIKRGMVGLAGGPDPEDPSHQIFIFNFEGEGLIPVTIMPDLLELEVVS